MLCRPTRSSIAISQNLPPSVPASWLGDNQAFSIPSSDFAKLQRSQSCFFLAIVMLYHSPSDNRRRPTTLSKQALPFAHNVLATFFEGLSDIFVDDVAAS